MYYFSTVLIIFSMIIKLQLVSNTDNMIKFKAHIPTELTDYHLTTLNNLSNIEHFRKTLREICIPRVVGTDGHKNVRNFIINSMDKLSWQVDLDIFENKTPNMGTLKFQNIIATQNPNANRFLILACHYDSKYFPDFEFLGATDSAVPCAMLINLAETLNIYLKDNNLVNNEISLIFVFFDGEEAFLEWNSNDSIYGARNLANKWSKNGFIKKIDMLVLLDLIGAPDPKFYSFFRETELWYTTLVDAETRLTNLGYLEKHTTSGFINKDLQQYFQASSANSYIEDDHIPFLKLGVPIIHLISVPFPDVWHKKEDNLNVVDYTTVENINKILRTFVAGYLKLSFDDTNVKLVN